MSNWFRYSDSAGTGSVPASGVVLYSVQVLHPPPLSVRPTVVLKGTLEQDLTTVGHERSTAR